MKNSPPTHFKKIEDFLLDIILVYPHHFKSSVLGGVPTNCVITLVTNHDVLSLLM